MTQSPDRDTIKPIKAVYPDDLTRDEYERALRLQARQVAAWLWRLFPELRDGDQDDE